MACSNQKGASIPSGARTGIAIAWDLAREMQKCTPHSGCQSQSAFWQFKNNYRKQLANEINVQYSRVTDSFSGSCPPTTAGSAGSLSQSGGDLGNNEAVRETYLESTLNYRPFQAFL